MRLSFIRLSAFRANWKRLGMTDGDLRNLESAILADPLKAPVMPGTGGLRKIRLSSHASSAGLSGGVRVCYACFAEFGLVYFCAVFPKNERANLSRKEANDYRHILAEFDRYLREYFRKGWTP
jgi:hypothetical protein